MGVGMSFVPMTIAAERVTPEQRKARLARLGRYWQPALGLVLPVVAAAAWELTVRMGLSNGRLLPPPSVIFATFWELAQTGELQRHTFATVWRVAAGFGLGVLAGTFAGAVTGYSPLMRSLLDPTVQGLRAIPSLAWVPLFVLWLGIFATSEGTPDAGGVFFPASL